ncbi:MAG: hypothetical protein IKP10_02380 [Clostridia bacterium]|nr:hypothetical protein [Clostridia bacterium]
MTNPMPPYGTAPMAPQPAVNPQKARDLSIASFVLSVASLVTTNLIGIALAVLALILSFKAEKNTYRKMAFILSIVGLSVGFLMLLFSILRNAITTYTAKEAFAWITMLIHG